MGGLCWSMFWYALLYGKHLDEEERAGCLAFIVFQMSCYCSCPVALPHDAVGLPAVCCRSPKCVFCGQKRLLVGRKRCLHEKVRHKMNYVNRIFVWICDMLEFNIDYSATVTITYLLKKAIASILSNQNNGANQTVRICRMTVTLLLAYDTDIIFLDWEVFLNVDSVL